MRRVFIGCACLVVGWLALSACNGLTETGREIGNAAMLQRDVARVAGTDVIVSIADAKRLELRLVNSPWAALPPAEKDRKASEIAKYAFVDYPERAKLESVSVFFVQRDSYLSTHYLTDETDAHRFPTEVLERAASQGA
jgi:hypothetical protein